MQHCYWETGDFEFHNYPKVINSGELQIGKEEEVRENDTESEQESKYQKKKCSVPM